MTTSRRTALAMLGMASTSAVGVESFLAPPARAGDIQSVAGAYQKEIAAKAFENLAREIRRDAVAVESLKLSASLEADSIANRHELVLKFLYMPEV